MEKAAPTHGVARRYFSTIRSPVAFMLLMFVATPGDAIFRARTRRAAMPRGSTFFMRALLARF